MKEKKGGIVFEHLLLRCCHLLTNTGEFFGGVGRGRNEFIFGLVIPVESEVHSGVVKSLMVRSN